MLICCNIGKLFWDRNKRGKVGVVKLYFLKEFTLFFFLLQRLTDFEEERKQFLALFKQNHLQFPSLHPSEADSQFHMLSKCSAFHWIKPSSSTWSFQSTKAVGSWAPFAEAQGALALLCLLPAKLVLPGDAKNAEMLWGWPERPHTLNAGGVLDTPGLAVSPQGHTQSLWTPAQCLDILRKPQEE